MNRWIMGKGECYTKKSRTIMRGRVIGNSLEHTRVAGSNPAFFFL